MGRTIRAAGSHVYMREDTISNAWKRPSVVFPAFGVMNSDGTDLTDYIEISNVILSQNDVNIDLRSRL